MRNQVELIDDYFGKSGDEVCGSVQDDVGLWKEDFECLRDSYEGPYFVQISLWFVLCLYHFVLM